MGETTYRAKDYARLFRSIPDDQWMTGFLESNGKKCALGHAGLEAQDDLDDICIEAFDLHTVFINDRQSAAFPQPTPKLRMVAAMEKAKELGF